MPPERTAVESFSISEAEEVWDVGEVEFSIIKFMAAQCKKVNMSLLDMTQTFYLAESTVSTQTKEAWWVYLSYVGFNKLLHMKGYL